MHKQKVQTLSEKVK